MEDTKIILSIVVPIYNVERYLRKCVDSLLNQDISNYEIILVDDGATDGSGAICDSYVSIDDRKIDNRCTVKVIHRENGGLSAARNSGIEVAKGEYLMFVDSDDYLEPNVLGLLIKRMEDDQLDVLRYNYQNINEQYEVFHPFKAAQRDMDYSESVVDGETFLNERLGPACYAWAFLIKRNLIIDDRCLFTEGIYFEDSDWTPRMLLRAKRAASTPMVVYNYLWRNGSITLPTDPKKWEKVLRDKISLLRGFKEQKKLLKDPKWYERMTSFTTMTILGMLATMPSAERKSYLDDIKAMRIFPLPTIRESGLNKMKIMMANVSPSIYCKLMHMIRK